MDKRPCCRRLNSQMAAITDNGLTRRAGFSFLPSSALAVVIFEHKQAYQKRLNLCLVDCYGTPFSGELRMGIPV